MGQPWEGTSETQAGAYMSVQVIRWQKPIRISQARLAWMRHLMHSLYQQRVARLSARQSRVALAASNWVTADQGWQGSRGHTRLQAHKSCHIQWATSPRIVLWDPGLLGFLFWQYLTVFLPPRLTLPFLVAWFDVLQCIIALRVHPEDWEGLDYFGKI